MPTSLRAGPSRSWRRIVSAPGKPPCSRRRLPIVQASPASIGRDLGGQLVAVEAKAGLEPQGVARAEAGRLDLRLVQQHARERRRVLGRDRDLEAVLAGIAGARDPAAVAGDAKLGGLHEAELRRRRGEPGHDGGGRGSLQRQEAARGQLLDPVRGLERCAHMREIGLAACGVDHHGKAALDPADDQIVEHATLLVRQHRIAQPVLARAR